MKKQSKSYPDVFYDRWKTPVSEIDYHYLNLAGMVETRSERYFFFEAYKSRKIYVMSVLSRYPLRIMDEGLASTCISKYFAAKGIYRRGSGRPSKWSSTWKFWNTDLIRELDENHELSGFAKERDKTICQYVVMTGDDWIEIVDCQPLWEVHRNTTVEKLIIKFVKERFDEIPADKKYVR